MIPELKQDGLEKIGAVRDWFTQHIFTKPAYELTEEEILRGELMRRMVGSGEFRPLSVAEAGDLVDSYLAATDSISMGFWLWGEEAKFSDPLPTSRGSRASDSYHERLTDDQVDPDKAFLYGRHPDAVRTKPVEAPELRTRIEFVFPAEPKSPKEGLYVAPQSGLYRPTRLTKDEDEAVKFVEKIAQNKHLVGVAASLTPTLKRKLADVRKGWRRVYFDANGKMKEAKLPKKTETKAR